MANPSGFGADAAYDRAVAAFAEQSYDVARRWVLEALAQNPEHAGARALLGRLDSVRRPANRAAPAPPPRSPFGGSGHPPGPETVSTDPTVLISHASRTPVSEPIEPTILVRRNDPRPAPPPAPDPFAAPRQPARDYTPVSEPTVIRRTAEPPPPPPPRTRPAAAGGGFLARWRDLLGGSPGAPRAAAPRPSGSRAGGLSPGMRGGALVVGAVIAAALLLWLGMTAVRWMWPGGQLLTLTRPTGGTIVGPGVECGTKGTDCSTTRPTGEAIELEVQADAGYVFSGFTGDCAPSGRMAMTAPRKCGARFDRTEVIAPAVTFPLTINKPVGGTIAGEPNILCGTLDNVCTATIAAGTAVTMRFQADTNFTFQSFTGDCAPNGEMTMNAAKTCGGIFMPTPGGTVVNRDTSEPAAIIKRPPPRRADDAAAAPRPPARVDPAATASAAQPQVAPPQPPPPPPPQPTVSGPAKDPISAEQHAKDEIEALVKTYCTENETLKPERIQKLFPLAPMSTYREQFRQYKTLKCTITSKPEFQRLDATATGGAQVLFGMKQVIQMKSGGAPKVYETEVTMVVSRTSFQAPWLIDRMVAQEKPK